MRLYNKGDFHLNPHPMHIRERITCNGWYIRRYSHTAEVTFRVIR